MKPLKAVKLFSQIQNGNPVFSKSTEYALRATIFIARKASKEKKATIKMVAEGIGAPQSFTAKILQQLTKKNTGIISSVTGPSGGLYISGEAKKRSIFTVLELMGEIEVIEKCIMGLPKCNDANPCSMHKSYKIIKQELLRMLREKTIEELARSKDAIL
ncbi:MAG: Rrf2 family transcriptional regulator [Chitinophagaceae bacterium]|nr:Rrf2 family transcriptional regulator [Chitinophagaceae bacterium]MCW5926647.1 Rrf2 family transcriptional regulator [Chitinophagaceae bacterium]